MIEIKLNVQTVKIDDVIPNDYNVNEMDGAMTEALSNTLGRYGQVSEVIVREKNGKLEIVDGEHRWRDLKDKKGERFIEVNNLGVLSDDDAKVLGLALNELRGTNDLAKMVDIVMALRTSSAWGGIRSALPLSDKDLEGLISFGEGLDGEGGIPFDDLVTGMGFKAPPADEELADRQNWTDVKVAIPLNMKEEIGRGFEDLRERFSINLVDEAQGRGEAFAKMVEEAYANLRLSASCHFGVSRTR